MSRQVSRDRLCRRNDDAYKTEEQTQAHMAYKFLCSCEFFWRTVEFRLSAYPDEPFRYAGNPDNVIFFK